MAFTYFFRDLHMLELIVRHVVPSLAGQSRPRIWDAGCAMGQEPYSLAILFAENMGYFGFNNLRIQATDVDESGQFGQVVAAGVYPEGELERMPPHLLQKYFERADPPGSLRVKQGVRECVSYRTHDLLSLDPIGEGFSLIVCKNVLLHFQADQRIEVIKMFHRALAPAGYFATEQTQKLPEETAELFEQVAADGQLFRKVIAADASHSA
jgi:chemotaxis protein methyltransferase CheR